MNKKSLKGYIKTRHFLERQKQRQVSDADIIRAISNGVLRENDSGHNFLLGQLKVIVDLNTNTLITVHPGGEEGRSKKMLSADEAKKVRQLIEEHKANHVKNDDADEFLKYVTENPVKKLLN